MSSPKVLKDQFVFRSVGINFSMHLPEICDVLLEELNEFKKGCILG